MHILVLTRLMDTPVSRRTVLASAGTAAVGVATLGANGVLAGDWTRVESGTGKTLHAVKRAESDVYAVGASGRVLRRSDGSWSVYDTTGPTGGQKTLYGADVTDGGRLLWVAGSSGSVGAYDLANGSVTSYKPPNVSPTFTDIAVAGFSGAETVYLTKSSGEVYVGTRADTKEGGMTWTARDTGGSYTIQAIDFHTPERGRVVSTNSSVYKTTDAGSTWTQVGIADSAASTYDIVSGPDRVFVGAATGRLWRHDCDCSFWTPLQAGSKAVRGLARDGARVLGAGESGRAFDRDEDGFSVTDTPTGNTLLDASIGETDILVGNSGTIIER